VTPEQRSLARHALGLPNDRRRSYRNRYVVEKEAGDGVLWMDLVSKGMARHRPGNPLTGGMDLFWLTAEGARAALDPRESLCPEDFPS